MSEYLIKSSLALLVSIVAYWLILKNERTFVFNRFYLLLTLLGSLLLPFLEIVRFPIVEDVQIYPDAVSSFLYHTVSSASSNRIMNSEYSFSVWSVLKVVYFLGVSIFFVKYLANLLFLFKLIRRNGAEQKVLKVVLLDFESRPFSFFNYLFISEDQQEEVLSNDALIQHELAHSKQLHSVDVLLIELVKCILWFNPLIWIYKSLVSENHEYLADESASSVESGVTEYSLEIIKSLQQKKEVPLTSSFNYINIKNRIIMLNKSNSKKRNPKLSVLLSAIIAVFTLVICSCKIGDASSLNIEGNGWLEDSNVGVVPYLLPIDGDLVSLASGFGLRKDPIYKTNKLHKGIDFKAKEGAEILASASGTVITTSVSDDGYGKYVVISHNDTYQTLYAHMSVLKVGEGDRVGAGDVIGVIGSSGRSTARHLHYEVMKNEKNVDPIAYFKKE